MGRAGAFALEVTGLTDIGEVEAGMDLGSVLATSIEKACGALQANDVVVVTQKIVSKAEGRLVDLDTVSPSEQALQLAQITRKDPRLVELVLRESEEIVRAVPHVLITRHRLGFVMANAGIDRSNIGSADGSYALLLPEDPDASARAIAESLSHMGSRPAVVISDSCGRPWRMGVVGIAIGASGFAALSDRRGEADREGRSLEVTQIAVADLLASAAGLVMGEGAEGVPAAVIRGFAPPAPERPAHDLVRRLDEDLFR